MKKLIFFVTLVLLFSITSNTAGAFDRNNVPTNSTYDNTMKQDILCLMTAYPQYVINVERTKEGFVYVIMKSGKKILYDDKKIKSHEEKLANPDLQDMLEDIYPLSTITKLSNENFDPGRSRVYSLFNEVYGGTKRVIEANLISINIGGKSCPFNSKNNAATSLERVANELIPLAKTNKDIQRHVFPCSGTFNYREIAGTNRLSAHSYGTAIDLAANKMDYWQWSSRKEGQLRLETYPKEITKIFERNNFIWGGKWGHFDLMHYEYRPEIILKAKYFSSRNNNEPWYYGAPSEEDNVKKYITKINEVME